MSERLGKYEILKKLGEGATATVFLGHDSFTGRDVAIKAVRTSVFADGEDGKISKKLFITEASLAGKLVHPHIVQIFDAVADSDPSYIVMEYVPGGTLEPYTKPDNLLPVPDVVEMIFKCSRALDFAHRLGVIHRDLKPANILRGDDSKSATDVKISDFGAALTVSSDQTQVSGIGSPAYMSPQQVMEHPLNHQSDIFSLGVVFYQLLTGHLPFQGTNNFSLVYQITHGDPLPPSQVRPDLPACLDGIVMKALEKELDKRYPTWDAFSFELAEAFRSEGMAEMREARVGDSDKFNLLRGLAFFRDFSDVAIWEVLRLSKWRRLHQGDALMREGEPGDHFCVLAEGEVKVSKQNKLLNILSAGDCFGEMAYLNPERGARMADVTAMGEGLVIVVATEALAQAGQATRHEFDRAFLRILVERLDMANTRLTSQAI
jgi:serine/threonine protein kinase